MDGVLKLFGIFMAMAIAGSAAYVVIVLANALVKRVEGRSGAPEALRADLEDLRTRVEEGEQARARISELEERLEFAERLLAQHRMADRLPASGEER
jgi:predicted outer membrane protein